MNSAIGEQTIDVTAIEPRQKRPAILKAWADLPDDGALVLLNDHDPLPLYFQFACEFQGGFRWEYLDRGPKLWRVRIAKGTFPHPGFVPAAVQPAAQPAAGTANPASPSVLDTRPIFERGDTPCQAIDEATAALLPGQSLILLVPFEPVPLYTKFERQGFNHAGERLADGTWRIEFQPRSP